MPERNVLRHESVEHHLHVVADVRVPVLVDGQAGRGVQQLDVHQTNGELREFRQLKERSGLSAWDYFYKLFSSDRSPVPSLFNWHPLNLERLRDNFQAHHR